VPIIFVKRKENREQNQLQSSATPVMLSFSGSVLGISLPDLTLRYQKCHTPVR